MGKSRMVLCMHAELLLVMCWQVNEAGPGEESWAPPIYPQQEKLQEVSGSAAASQVAELALQYPPQTTPYSHSTRSNDVHSVLVLSVSPVPPSIVKYTGWKHRIVREKRWTRWQPTKV